MRDREQRFFLDQRIHETLLGSGVIWNDGSSYVGTASDGVEVLLGTVGDEESLERYLTKNPTPSHW